MIEIELKYELKKKPEIKMAPASTREVEDIYYDTKDYLLLRNGNFLRIRNKKQLDFKLNSNDQSHLYCKETNFSLKEESIPGINDVLKNIHVDTPLSSIQDLSSKFSVLAPIKKKRTSYHLEENVVMVIDEVEDLGTFLEIEYDYSGDLLTKEKADYYKNYLIDLLKRHSLFDSSMREAHIGYVELYLKKHNPEAYHLGLYQE